MRTSLSRLMLAASIAAFALSAQAGGIKPPDNDSDLVPSGKGWGERAAPGRAAGHAKPGSGSNGIFYHGGPVMLGVPTAYYIWYGDWTGNDATTILTDLAQNIGNSAYFRINSTYSDGSNKFVSGDSKWGTSSVDNYSHGTALSDSAVMAVVANAINTGALPKDPNAVYFVLTSSDVNETSGFCTQYCGWHTHGSVGGTDIKFAFIGNPDRCPSACEIQEQNSPNGNPGADGMASIIAHEFEEAITDPDLNAWYDRRGEENADKCAWTFGTTSIAANGSRYNMTIGSRRYMIQQNWVNAAGGYCDKQYP